MKKIISIVAITSLVATLFAAEPVAKVNVAEFSGEASVTWGVNLDTNKTGFTNAENVVLKLNLFNGGEKSTTGEGVWGELKIKTDSDTFIGWEGTGEFGANKGMTNALKLKTVVDTAKIHFGPVYLGITSGDTGLGGDFKYTNSIAYDNGDIVQGAVFVKDSVAGHTDYTQGIVLGFANDKIKAEGNIRSKKDGDVKETNNYAYSVDLEVKPITDMRLYVGFNSIITPDTAVDTSRNLFIGAEHRFTLVEKYFIQPVATFAIKDMSADSNSQLLIAGIRFGWAGSKDESTIMKDFGCNFLKDPDGDDNMLIPGVGFYTNVGINASTTNSPFLVTFYSGDIIENFRLAAEFLTYSSDFVENIQFALGASYAIKADEVTITPKFACKFEKADNLMRFGAAIDVAGLVDNTTFSVKYNAFQKSDVTTTDTKGNLDFTAKIAL